MITVAILCGGHGTRSEQPINKCFVEVAGKPFILHLMEMLENEGFTTFVLLRGTSGTLAAIQDARQSLGERFLLLYGDTLLQMNYSDFITQWSLSELPHATAMHNGVDAGVNGVVTSSLDATNDSDFTSFKKIMAETGRTYFYDAPNPWLEVGTPEALQKTRMTLSE